MSSRHDSRADGGENGVDSAALAPSGWTKGDAAIPTEQSTRPRKRSIGATHRDAVVESVPRPLEDQHASPATPGGRNDLRHPRAPQGWKASVAKSPGRFAGSSTSYDDEISEKRRSLRKKSPRLSSKRSPAFKAMKEALASPEQSRLRRQTAAGGARPSGFEAVSMASIGRRRKEPIAIEGYSDRAETRRELTAHLDGIKKQLAGISHVITVAEQEEQEEQEESEEEIKRALESMRNRAKTFDTVARKPSKDWVPSDKRRFLGDEYTAQYADMKKRIDDLDEADEHSRAAEEGKRHVLDGFTSFIKVVSNSLQAAENADETLQKFEDFCEMYKKVYAHCFYQYLGAEKKIKRNRTKDEDFIHSFLVADDNLPSSVRRSKIREIMGIMGSRVSYDVMRELLNCMRLSQESVAQFEEICGTVRKLINENGGAGGKRRHPDFGKMMARTVPQVEFRWKKLLTSIQSMLKFIMQHHQPGFGKMEYYSRQFDRDPTGNVCTPRSVGWFTEMLEGFINTRQDLVGEERIVRVFLKDLSSWFDAVLRDEQHKCFELVNYIAWRRIPNGRCLEDWYLANRAALHPSAPTEEELAAMTEIPGDAICIVRSNEERIIWVEVIYQDALHIKSGRTPAKYLAKVRDELYEIEEISIRRATVSVPSTLFPHHQDKAEDE